jgi:uncharacterized protein YdaU (DUF1376 family)
MAQAPIMPVFTDALIGDTTHLSTEQFGAYVLILLATWRNNGKALPDDDARMAHVCRISVARWRKNVRPVLVEFFKDGWHQPRLEKEWNRVNRLIEVRRTEGRKGGKASAASRGNSDGHAIQKEASLPKDSESRSDSESEAAREGKKNQSLNPLGRYAPLGGSFGGRCHPEPGPDAISNVPHRTVRPRSCAKSPALKAKIRDQLMQKHARFLMARRRSQALAAYWGAQLGDDPAKAQRAFDAVDRRMRSERWDDMRQWKREHGIVA